MGFIEGDQVPIPGTLFACELRDEAHCLIRRDANVEIARLHLLSQNSVPMLSCAKQIDNPKLGSPVLELFDPVWDGAFRSDD